MAERRATGPRRDGMRRPAGWRRWLPAAAAAWGPGLMVMLADTDAGSVITAAQSGARWGYRMVLPQLLLIPVLYLVQEVTVRLGLATGQGHGELIRARFGRRWAYLSVGSLFLASVGALITEFAGIAGVGALWGAPPWLSVGATTLLLIGVGVTGSYARVERAGIALGAFEAAFVAVAVMARPSGAQLAAGLASLPLGDRGYLYLLAANVGAVIMPWMVFYQQGAVVDKGLTRAHLRDARRDTAVGAVVTQLVMIAVVVATAATVGRVRPGAPLNDVAEIAQGLVPFLGRRAAAAVFGLGMLGASLVAALVVSIAGAWGLGEALGFPHSLNRSVGEARAFYGVYTLAHVGGAVLVLASRNLVDLAVDVEVMNAMLLPLVLGFLLALEARALPPEWRMRGPYRALVWATGGLVMAFGLYTAAATFAPGL
jgi:Mn2+/Fe2+ NRAMP family transporter